jgi:hypothetical protein
VTIVNPKFNWLKISLNWPFYPSKGLQNVSDCSSAITTLLKPPKSELHTWKEKRDTRMSKKWAKKDNWPSMAVLSDHCCFHLAGLFLICGLAGKILLLPSLHFLPTWVIRTLCAWYMNPELRQLALRLKSHAPVPSRPLLAFHLQIIWAKLVCKEPLLTNRRPQVKRYKHSLRH